MRLLTHLRGLASLDDGSEVDIGSVELRLFELLLFLGLGNFRSALPRVLLEPAAELSSRLEVDLLRKLLRRPGMSREVRLALLVMGGMRLEVELEGSRRSEGMLDRSSRRSENEADEMPPPM